MLVILPRADAAATYRGFSCAAAALATLAALAVTTIAPLVADPRREPDSGADRADPDRGGALLATERYARRIAGPTRRAAIRAGATAAPVAANAAILVAAYAAWPPDVAVLSGLTGSDEPLADTVANTVADNAWVLGTLAAV